MSGPWEADGANLRRCSVLAMFSSSGYQKKTSKMTQKNQWVQASFWDRFSTTLALPQGSTNASACKKRGKSIETYGENVHVRILRIVRWKYQYYTSIPWYGY